jgi:Uncharacterized protein conserved in bacteria
VSSARISFNPHWVGFAQLGVPRYGAGAFVYNNVLYVVGGVSRAGVSPAVERIDLETLTRSYGALMPEARAHFAFGVVEGKLYVLGGVDRGGMPTNTIFVYDIVNNSWSTLPTALPKKVAYCGYSTLGGEIYAIGGVDEEGNILRDVYSLNTANSTVSTKAPLNIARQNHACAALANKVYCFGGDDGSSPLGSVEAYDPAADKWALLDVTLPEPLTGLAAISVIYGGRENILLVGG